MKEKAVLEKNPKGEEKESYEYAEVLKQVIVDKKIELDNLQSGVMNMQGRLASLQAQMGQEKNKFDNHIQVENKKVEESQKKLKADTENSLRRVDVAQADMNKRESEISMREKRVIDLEKEKNATIEARQELGKLSFNLDLKLKEAQESKVIAEEKINNCSKLMDDIKKREEKLKTLESILNGKNDKIQEDLKRVEDIKSELVILREEIKPKLDELDNKKKELVTEQRNLTEKTEEFNVSNEKNLSLIAQLDEKMKQLDSKKKELFAKETELSQREARVILLEKTK